MENDQKLRDAYSKYLAENIPSFEEFCECVKEGQKFLQKQGASKKQLNDMTLCFDLGQDELSSDHPLLKSVLREKFPDASSEYIDEIVKLNYPESQ